MKIHARPTMSAHPPVREPGDCRRRLGCSPEDLAQPHLHIRQISSSALTIPFAPPLPITPEGSTATQAADTTTPTTRWEEPPSPRAATTITAKPQSTVAPLVLRSRGVGTDRGEPNPHTWPSAAGKEERRNPPLSVVMPGTNSMLQSGAQARASTGRTARPRGSSPTSSG